MKSKLFILIIIFYCKVNLFAGDFPIFVNSFLSQHYTQYDSLKYDKPYTSILDSSKYLWKQKVKLKSKKQYLNKYNQVVYQRLYFSFYWFKDSTSCKNAFDNFLRCFNTDCYNVKSKINIDALKAIPTLVIFDPEKGFIIVLSTGCEHESQEYIKIKKELLSEFLSSGSSFIDVGCGGPLKWDLLIDYINFP